MDESERGGRPFPVLIVLMLLAALPLLALGLFDVGPAGPQVSSGVQPGGRIAGRVLPANAARDVRTVTLVHARSEADGSIGSVKLLTAQLAADGSFVFDAPPIEGFYIVSAGSGTWQQSSHQLSMLLENGESVAVPDCELTLEPGCDVEFRVRLASGEDVESAQLGYAGKLSGGALFGLLPGTTSGSTTIRHGKARLQGARPFEGTVTVHRGDGTTRDFPVTVHLGRQVIDLTL